MTNTPRSRQPQGVPTGGQFAAEARTEAECSLTDTVGSATTFTTQPNQPFTEEEMLAGLTRYLNESGVEIDEFTTKSDYDTQELAQALDLMHQDRGDLLPGVGFEAAYNSDGEHLGNTIGMRINGLYIAEFGEIGDVELDGIEGALKAARDLEYTRDQIISKARDSGVTIPGEDYEFGLVHRAADHGVAVTYQGRYHFEDTLGRPLTDDEWDRVKPHLADFDEWMDSSGAAESIAEWRSQVADKVFDYDDDTDEWSLRA